jgi:hypothetical protein
MSKTKLTEKKLREMVRDVLRESVYGIMGANIIWDDVIDMFEEMGRRGHRKPHAGDRNDFIDYARPLFKRGKITTTREAKEHIIDWLIDGNFGYPVDYR